LPLPQNRYLLIRSHKFLVQFSSPVPNTDKTQDASLTLSTLPGDKRRRFYLPEVDGIRCVAFLLVWLHHYPQSLVLGQFGGNGWIGVDVFLILSSFLITSLLMIENEAKGVISLPRFYSRRFLRIWPLLGLALFLNYVVLPAIDYFPGGFHNGPFLNDLKYHGIPNLLLLGNWSVAVFSYLQYGFCSQLWTINLEEQFYLIWPLLMVYLAGQPRRLWISCLGIIIISYLARLYYSEAGFHHPALWVSTITRMDLIGLGAILALLYRSQKGWIRSKKRWMSAILSVVIFALAVKLVTILLHNWTFAGDVWWKIGVADICITVAIGCVLNSVALAYILRLPPIAWLGKISYGLYVYHRFFTESRLSEQFRSFALRSLGAGAPLSSWLLGMVINGLALVAISALSYYCFERWFLKLKERFETVLSRPA
jgi:peptidoglycan/LPS O-acetylase OafA/YrhL